MDELEQKGRLPDEVAELGRQTQRLAGGNPAFDDRAGDGSRRARHHALPLYASRRGDSTLYNPSQ
jgi:hypothetical protein